MTCLSDENLAALVGGSANAEQSATWKAHLAGCDSCTLRYGRKQAGLDELAKPDAASGPADDDGSRDADATDQVDGSLWTGTRDRTSSETRTVRTTKATTARPQALAFWNRILRWARWLKFGATTVVVLFFVLLAAEATRFYFLVRDVHPLLGYGVLALVGAGSLLLAIPAYRFFSVPRALTPPSNPPFAEMTMTHLRAEVRFLDRYLRNCRRNPEFADKWEEIDRARDELDGLMRKAGRGGSIAELNDKLVRWTGRRMAAVLGDVDERAERLIYQEALAVGIGTAASPNGTLDAFVMLWRSVNLASKLAILYYGKPGPMGILAICRDVTIAVVSAAYLDTFSDSLGRVLTKTVGGVTGVVAGPAVEGVTNALVVIRIGYLTKERCRSFRYWNQNAQRSAFVKALQATQKVAIGLTTEIFRQVGTGLGAVADVAAKNIAEAAGAAAKRVGSVAGAAWSSANEFGEKIGAMFTRSNADAETRRGGETDVNEEAS